MERWYAENLNGSTTGLGSLTPLPDGAFAVRAAFGSPFGGHVCDDGPVYEAVLPTREAAERWLRHHRMNKGD